MADDNGAKPTIPFAAPGAIPILGQAFELRGIIPQVLIRCTCEAREPVLLIGFGAQHACPACHRVFMLQAVRGEAGGNAEASINVGSPRPSPTI